MTEKLYYNNMEMKEFSAKIVSVNGNEIILDRTVFYPTGGGQPNDTGTMTINGQDYKVIDVKKNDGDVIHVIEGEISASPGDEVKGTIDWERRYAHMRYHTAVHILDGIVTKKYNEQAMLTGGQLYQDKARVDFDMPEFTKELVEKIIQDANDIIAADLKVYQKEVTREEALSMDNIARTGPGRDLISNLDTVRLIVIEGLDHQSDGGTHVSSTGQVGKISLTKIQNKGKRNKRVEFTIAP